MTDDDAREKCTQGEWCTRSDDAAGVIYRSIDSCEEVAQTGSFDMVEAHANAALIAHEHNDYPKRLDDLRHIKAVAFGVVTPEGVTDAESVLIYIFRYCTQSIQQAETVEGS